MLFNTTTWILRAGAGFLQQDFFTRIQGFRSTEIPGQPLRECEVIGKWSRPARARGRIPGATYQM
jgi:hypothetical protein